MDKETYLSGSVAIDKGFADELLPADQMKVDDETKVQDREVNHLRALELTLVSAGQTRAEARDHISKIAGTPGAARKEGTPGAALAPGNTGPVEPKADDLDPGLLAGILATLRS
jgi:hypothetical protein